MLGIVFSAGMTVTASSGVLWRLLRMWTVYDVPILDSHELAVVKKRRRSFPAIREREASDVYDEGYDSALFS